MYDPNDISIYGRFSLVEDPAKVIYRERECSTCIYFDRSLFDGFDAGTGPGYCRRYPPLVYVPTSKVMKQTQPIVSPWEWCGEWQKA